MSDDEDFYLLAPEMSDEDRAAAEAWYEHWDQTWWVGKPWWQGRLGTDAEREALRLIRDGGHRQARTVARMMADGFEWMDEDQLRHHREVLRLVDEYRAAMPRWRRLLGF
jgi:hypothetical protein